MPSSAPGALREPRSPAQTRRQTALALGTLGAIVGGIMGLVFFSMAAFGVAIDAEATRAEETALMLGTVALVGLSVVGAVGGSVARSHPSKGAAMLGIAGGGGVATFLLMGAVEVVGLTSGTEGFLVDALWLIVGFWSIPAILFFTAATMARAGVETG